MSIRSFANGPRAREASAELFNDRRMEKAQALYEEAMSRLESGEGFPRGVVEAIRASMQEDAREAALRDDSRYGDRKRLGVELDAPKKAVPEGLPALYAALKRDADEILRREANEMEGVTVEA